MGTDIHVAMQAKQNGQWETVPHQYDETRHYFLFAWLANVRNGFGFAGVRTFNPIKPIAEPRGLPDDILLSGGDEHPVACKELMGRRGAYHEEGEDLAIWLGDHSHSWLTADEILTAPKPGRTWHTGIVTRELFDAWDGHSKPSETYNMIGGHGVKIAPSPVDVDDDSTYVRIFWMVDEGTQVQYFIDEIQRLKDLHGEVRMVFGFDS